MSTLYLVPRPDSGRDRACDRSLVSPVERSVPPAHAPFRALFYGLLFEGAAVAMGIMVFHFCRSLVQH